ncbi:MAG: lipopolysaccharide heptosyltransferase II [Nitrospinae bacterium]|nr:lipopolysaccharide heptosyltransferase II [Nitrospinota bacterium]
MEINKKDIKDILVWCPNWIGDVIMCIPAIMALRTRYPNAGITAVVGIPGNEILKGNSIIDEVIPYQRRGERYKSLTEGIRLIRYLRKRDLDMAVIFPNSFRSALMVLMTGARYRIGYLTEGRGLFLTTGIKVTEYKKDRHMVEYFLDIVRAIGCKTPKKRPSFRLHPKERGFALDYLHNRGVNDSDLLIGIHPGASKPPRAWSSKRFGMLCDRLYRDLCARIIIFGGSNDKGMVSDIVSGIESNTKQRLITAVGETDLMQTAALIERCHIFVGNDSGIMHIAGMVKTPIVAIFGPGRPEETGPFCAKEKVEIISKDYPCSPCRHRFFKECKPSIDNKSPCIEDIEVADVMRGVERLIERGVVRH